MRVLVCGGRHYFNRESVYTMLDATHKARRIDCVIHGAAHGADILAQDWADDRGICCIQFPAKWDRDGKAAGPIRNRKMLDEGKPDILIAFPGGRGTANMIQQAGKIGLLVVAVAK